MEPMKIKDIIVFEQSGVFTKLFDRSIPLDEAIEIRKSVLISCGVSIKEIGEMTVMELWEQTDAAVKISGLEKKRA